MILDRINQANDIKKLKPEEYPLLAQEIRRLMIRTVSKNGGHLASNLGVVELTMALHLVLDLPKDKLIFDVGHQCYTHKILSGRKDSFDTLRREGGISGFPKMAESDCDVFDTGHSSTSVSLGLGLAQARDRKGEDYAVVSVIGDGSLTGGMAFEALNNASHLKSNFIIVVNDNNMSIARNVGGMTHALQDLRTAPRYNRLKENVKNALDKIPNVGGRLVRGIGHAKDVVKQILLPDMFFEGLGLTYLGPVDGHDISQLIDTLQDARRVNRPVVVHVITKKGKGYRFAENDPERFHGIGPFDIRSGETAPPAKTYTDYVSQGLLKLAETDPDVVAVTAAMAAGTGLDCFRKHYSERLFDVGIAEQHAVT
ncbi:MAG: 1-deoxy-D-xylulose-5-phosphate synthase, partial [Lachnospiraceae bacterium]|nr:1-deoxy-D-xylulose-5-phosphate synthase [Lachnospiraceae bacterium]